MLNQTRTLHLLTAVMTLAIASWAFAAENTYVAPGNPDPEPGAKVKQVYQDPAYGHTELRDDDYHRHREADGAWTPWHYRYQKHNWWEGQKQAAKPAAPKRTHAATGNAMAFSGAAVTGTSDQCCGQVTLNKEMPPQVVAGAPFDYQMVLTNHGSTTVYNVRVIDYIPDGFAVKSTEPSAKKQGKTLTWTLEELKGGASKTMTVRGTPGENVERIKTCATVKFEPRICDTTRVVKPALKLAKEMTEQVLLCDPIQAKYTLSNDGTGAVSNVTVVDDLPDGLVTSSGKDKIEFSVDSLAPGQSRAFAAELKANKTGKFKNTAKATADAGLSSEDSATVTVTQPVLTLDKTGPKKVFLGRNVTYEITVKNTGDAASKNTKLVDTLGGGASFVRATDGGQFANGKVTWNLGTLQPKGSKKVAVTLRPTGEGDVEDTARVSGYCADAKTASAATAVEGIPAVLLEVIDENDPVEVGNETTYVIIATNQGSAVGTNIQIVATLEAEHEFVSAGGATRASAKGKTITFAPLPALAPQAKATWRVKVKAVKPASVRFGIKMTLDQVGDRPVTETEATNFYE